MPQDAPWLDDVEMRAWLGLVGVLARLPQALDRQLRDETGINHPYYLILAMLSEADDGTLGMSELARRTSTSLSRLSHAVSSLEQRGWVTREASTCGRRAQVARLTRAGREVVERVAPAHVRHVRELVFDPLTREQVQQLAEVTGTILAGLPCPTQDHR